MTDSAFVFPGQGSQFVGMGRDLYENFGEARAVFDSADQALGVSLSGLCFQGPEQALTDTINAQPALLAHSIATLRVLQGVLGSRFPAPAFMAGHSLGEYSALVAAGSLEFQDAIRLVRARGEAMKRAGEEHPGAMAALLALDDQQVAAVCAEAGAVQVANYNAPGQVVISGEKEALERAIALAKKAGAKRAVALAVSIAAHSELMRPAALEYNRAVISTPVRPPQLPVISNITGEPLKDVDEIRTEMVAQLTSPVEWVKTIRFMGECGVKRFLELGGKDVLSGLIKRIEEDPFAVSVGNLATVNAFIQSTMQGA